MSDKIPTHLVRPSVLHKEFESLVTVDSYARSLEERRVINGEHPFKVWREHFCVNKDDVAEALGYDIVAYTLIEGGEDEIDADDILRFCQYFGLHPDDLMNNDTPSDHMIEALLELYDDPSLIPHNPDRPDDLTEQILLREARGSFDELQSAYYSLNRRYKREHAVTLEFLEKALRLDGHLKVEILDIFDQASDFSMMSRDEEMEAGQKYLRLAHDHKLHCAKYHLFGRYLHRDQWPTVNGRLFRCANKYNLDDTRRLYYRNPEFSGLKGFPELTASLWLDGRGWTWRQAQARHNDIFEATYLSAIEKNRANREKDKLSLANDIFDEWVDHHYETLARYDNRQRIIKHPDFAHLRQEFVPYQKPARKVDVGLHRMFGVNPS